MYVCICICMCICIYIYTERFIFGELAHLTLEAQWDQNLLGRLAVWRLRKQFQFKSKGSQLAEIHLAQLSLSSVKAFN